MDPLEGAGPSHLPPPVDVIKLVRNDQERELQLNQVTPTAVARIFSVSHNNKNYNSTVFPFMVDLAHIVNVLTWRLHASEN